MAESHFQVKVTVRPRWWMWPLVGTGILLVKIGVRLAEWAATKGHKIDVGP